jgi:pimeloyl-ACP methyl ester carboxylesterase
LSQGGCHDWETHLQDRLGLRGRGRLPTVVDGHEYISGQMYVEVRIPARKTKPHPIIMVHGGTMSGTNYTGTPDGREGWAQYFVREGYAVYVVDQPGRGRSGYLAGTYGPSRNVVRGNSASRFVSQEKSKLWPQAQLHSQWPGTGEPDDEPSMQLASSQLPAIESFAKQQLLNRDALVALLEKIGPSILLVHSQAGAFGWPVADARPDRQGDPRRRAERSPVPFRGFRRRPGLV